jgi:hypothetical protein
MLKAQCPQCVREQICDVRAAFEHKWEAGAEAPYIYGKVDHAILQCRGCEFVFYETRSSSTDDVDVRVKPFTGEQELYYPVTTATFSELPPPALRRSLDAVVVPLCAHFPTLGAIVREVYVAREQKLFVLGAVGLRTAFDCATTLLDIDPDARLKDKVLALQERGFIGTAQAAQLQIVVEAGSAAAHRGWSPTAGEFDALLKALEGLLRTAFLDRGDSVHTIDVPPRPARHPKA